MFNELWLNLSDNLILLAYPFFVTLIVTGILGWLLIPWLHKLKFGQEIREEGPSWHQKKTGTPTMGGIMFIIGVGICVLIMNLIKFQPHMLLMYGVSLGFGIIGFIDDYIKVVKKRNLGLTSTQKFGLQLIVSAIYLFALNYMGELSTDVIIPFTSIIWTIPLWLYIPAVLILITGIVNAVNLTDGIDGLASNVTSIVALFFALVANVYLDNETLVFAISIFAACEGFLIYNRYPAKVFMGDTGSLFFGGAIVAMSIGMKLHLVVLIAGFVFIFEALSVIIQVISFKFTGKRVFKMSPIHHHFEMCGWNEKKIVRVFTITTAILCLISLYSLLFNLNI